MLEIVDLSVQFKGRNYSEIDNISFEVKKNQIVAFVGESGSGKTVTIHSIFSFLKKEHSTTKAKKAQFLNFDLLSLSRKEQLNLRRENVGFIFQDPMNCLNPTVTIGKQIHERLHPTSFFTSKKDKKVVLSLLQSVSLNEPDRIYTMYPFELSGGMLQRVMIAMALATKPQLLIADEPTTSLDVGIQQEILSLLVSLRDKLGISILLISHDLGLVSQVTDRVYVYYKGNIVESGPTQDILYSPKHPYTRLLLNSVPFADKPRLSFTPQLSNSELPTGKGCVFSSKCPYVMPMCCSSKPPATQKGDRMIQCYLEKK